MEDPRSLAAWLQRRALILSKEHHDIDYVSPYDIYYCITVGFWNPLLDRTQFFEWIEKPLRCTIPGMDPRLRVEREGASTSSRSSRRRGSGAMAGTSSTVLLRCRSGRGQDAA